MVKSEDTYTLVYFGIRGRGEILRWLFTVAEVPYTEQTIAFADWESVKPTVPFGVLPLLRIRNDSDGEKLLSQTTTIARYLATQFGLRGRNSFENAAIDQYVDGFKDMFSGYEQIVMASTTGGQELESACNAFMEKYATPTLERYEKFLHDSPEKSGFFVGDRVTLADLYIAEWLDRIAANVPTALDPYPGLRNLHHRIVSLPAIRTRIVDRQSKGISSL